MRMCAFVRVVFLAFSCRYSQVVRRGQTFVSVIGETIESGETWILRSMVRVGGWRFWCLEKRTSTRTSILALLQCAFTSVAASPTRTHLRIV